MITGRVDSVTTSTVKSLDASAKYFERVGEIIWTRRRNYWTHRRNILDASAKFLDASAKYFGRVGKILGRVCEIFWTRRWRFGRLGGTRLFASARIPLRRHIFGRLGTKHLSPRYVVFSAKCVFRMLFISL